MKEIVIMLKQPTLPAHKIFAQALKHEVKCQRLFPLFNALSK